MPKPDSLRQVLTALAKLRFASPYNFTPFLTKYAISPKGYFCNARRIFNRFLYNKDDRGNSDPLIQKVNVFGRLYHSTIKDTFYALTASGYKAIENQYKQVAPESVSRIEHESGLNDILLGFIYGFPDFKVEIKRNSALDKSQYKPDAIIKMTDPDGKEYQFIVEFERTRDWRQIREEKLLPASKIKPKERLTRHLYFYTWERFNVFWRPIEYPNHPREYETSNRKFWEYKKVVKGVPDYFLFAKYTDFTRLNQTVFYSVDGQPRKLIQ